MNAPYVKQFDENGVVTNPINGKYVNEFPNRSQRNAKKPRDFNNKNSTPTVIHGRFRYIKRFQFIEAGKNKKGKFLSARTVLHYDLAN
jgi:hypothetical protein